MNTAFSFDECGSTVRLQETYCSAWTLRVRHKPRRVRRPSWYLYLPTKAGRLTPDMFLHIFLSTTSCASHSAIHPRLTP
nr:MAG TPA: hypothetical protein [Caudoviricetes sp.]